MCFTKILNKEFSIKRFFKRFFTTLYFFNFMLILLCILTVLNLFSFLEISDRYSRTVFEIIMNSFANQ